MKTMTYSFTEPFIEKLCDYIQTEYIDQGKDLSRVALVFGGKRPALFIRRELARRLKTNFFPPRFFAINEFIANIVGRKEEYTTGLDLDNHYLIYQIAKAHNSDVLRRRERFAEFLPWAREIAAFIDQIDLEDVRNDQLKNIEANAEIGYEVPEDINRLLEGIVDIREEYHRKLLAEKTYSRGLLYRRAAELIKETDFPEFDEILFCNFFYFNHCEETIVKELYERGKAALIFQGDQRLWPILDRTARRLKIDIKEGETPDPTTFDLKLYSGFDTHSQVCMVREILKKIPGKDLEKTVVVLPEASNIIPLLTEISPIVEEFNISMGYPLKRSSLYSLFENMFNAQLSRREQGYYARDYLKVIRHPFIKNLMLADNPAVMRVLVHKIEEVLTGQEPADISGSLFIDLEDILSCDELYMAASGMLDRMNISALRADMMKMLETVHEQFFSGMEDARSLGEFAGLLQAAMDLLVEKSFMRHYPLNLNIAAKVYEITDELKGAAFREEEFIQEEIFRIFKNKLDSEIVAFQGSPLKGLQVLGLFETRSLNFQHAIILDVNEGSLPNLNIYEPLIPREVMISLNLDRLELEEEIQRYQFMRLISSAKNVHLVYQESKEKEKSRFVEELIWERQKKSGTMEPVAVERPSFAVKIAPKEESVRKSPEVVEFLKDFRFSASSVNTYLRDPLEFYMNHVLAVREQEDLLDEPEARHVGTFVHNFLEHMFLPLVGKKYELTPRFLKTFEEEFDRRFDETFGRSMKSDSFLLKNVMSERLRRFLEAEARNERHVASILHLEKRFEDVIPLSCGKIHFGYIVDRVDKLKDGTIMIVDYKTGGNDLLPKALNKILPAGFSRETILQDIRSFQIPLYFHYLSGHFRDQKINAGLYNLRTMEFKKFLDEKNRAGTEQINEVFMNALDHVVSEILDPNVPFVRGDVVYS